MKLQLLRFGEGIEISPGKVSVLEVESRRLFTRVVRALLSERGQEADEPYQLWDDNDKAVNPKKALVVLNALPAVPYDNKTLLGKLYTKVERMIEGDDELERKLREMGWGITSAIEDVGIALWGNYCFDARWSLGQYLRAFGFHPDCGDDEPLLENCIRFLGLCADVDQAIPVVMVNAKMFFDRDELEELYSQAVFLGTSLLLLETQHDSIRSEQERKMVIDQDFLVSR